MLACCCHPYDPGSFTSKALERSPSGASREQILNTAEAAETRQVRLASLEALQNCLNQPHSDLALIAFLRFWAEVLVSVEYECLWPRLSDWILNKYMRKQS